MIQKIESIGSSRLPKELPSPPVMPVFSCFQKYVEKLFTRPSKNKHPVQ